MRRNHGWSENFDGYSIDFENVAEQSLPSTRRVPLAATMPNDGILGVDNGGLVHARCDPSQ